MGHERAQRVSGAKATRTLVTLLHYPHRLHQEFGASTLASPSTVRSLVMDPSRTFALRLNCRQGLAGYASWSPPD